MSGRALTGRQVLVVTLGFFALVLGANVTMAMLALQTFTGSDEDDAYRKGLAFNETLDRRHTQLADGVIMGFEAARADDGTVRVDVSAEQNGAAIEAEAITVEFRHPANRRLDRSLSLTPAGAGAFEGELSGLPAGAWNVRVLLTDRAGRAREAGRRVWLP